MNFLEAKNYIKNCEQNWESLKNQFNGRERQLLNDAYLVISYDFGQFNLSEFRVEDIALHHSSLLIETDFNLEFVKLVKKRDLLMGQIKGFQDRDVLQHITRQIERINTGVLQLNEFRVEARFTQLKFDLIQKLKDSEFVDKSKTDMSLVSIRVVLR